MVRRLIINCQSAIAGEDSLNIVDGLKVDKSEATKLKIADLCYADSTFKVVSKDNLSTVFSKDSQNGKICVIYGHLNERDESGRRIPFCSYAEYDTNVDEVIYAVNQEFKKYSYSTVIHLTNTAKPDETIVVHKYSRKRIGLMILVGLGITALVAGYLINSCSEQTNNDDNNGTEQTN